MFPQQHGGANAGRLVLAEFFQQCDEGFAGVENVVNHQDVLPFDVGEQIEVDRELAGIDDGAAVAGCLDQTRRAAAS